MEASILISPSGANFDMEVITSPQRKEELDVLAPYEAVGIWMEKNELVEEIKEIGRLRIQIKRSVIYGTETHGMLYPKKYRKMIHYRIK